MPSTCCGSTLTTPPPPTRPALVSLVELARLPPVNPLMSRAPLPVQLSRTRTSRLVTSTQLTPVPKDLLLDLVDLLPRPNLPRLRRRLLRLPRNPPPRKIIRVLNFFWDPYSHCCRSAPTATQTKYGQCGGTGYNGREFSFFFFPLVVATDYLLPCSFPPATVCASGSTCTAVS